jgi:N-carbamoylputrescine amidase
MTKEQASRKEASPGLLAAVQMSSEPGLIDKNLEAIENALLGLPVTSSRLVVFPEMAAHGYFFDQRDRLWALSEPIPDGPTIKKLVELAERYTAYLIVGMAEREGDELYNSAVLVGPEGYVTKYRKLHLWSEEKLLYTPGNLGMVVAELPIGRVGLLICYDLWFPEQARILRLLGADVIAAPAALVWNDTPSHVKRGYYMADYVAMMTAHLNQVYLSMASQVGRYDNHWLFGSSILVGPYGWPLVEPADDEHPKVLDCEVDFYQGRRLRGWGQMDNFDLDRRVDVYDPLLGYRR